MDSPKLCYVSIVVVIVVFQSNLVIAQSSNATSTMASINATPTINSLNSSQSLTSSLEVRASNSVSESSASVLMTTFTSTIAVSQSMTIGLNDTLSDLTKVGESTSYLGVFLNLSTSQTLGATQTASLAALLNTETSFSEIYQTLSMSLSLIPIAQQTSTTALQTSTSTTNTSKPSETLAPTTSITLTMMLPLTTTDTILVTSTPSSFSDIPVTFIQASPTTALPSQTANSTTLSPSTTLVTFFSSLSPSSTIASEFFSSTSVAPSFISMSNTSLLITSSSTPSVSSSMPVTSSSMPVTSSSMPNTSSSMPVTSSSTPKTTPSALPTTSTSPSATVMTIKADQTGSYPMNLPMNFSDFKTFNSCLSNLQIKQCIVSVSYIFGTNYLYKITSVKEIPINANALIASIKPFVCVVDDLYTLFQEPMGNMTCTRQDCPSTSSSCLNITMGNVLWYWSPTQNLSIEYDPKVVDIICSRCVPLSSPTVATTQTTTVVTTQTTTVVISETTTASDDLSAGGLRGQRNSGHSAIILGVILGILVVVVLVVLGVVWFKWRVGHQGAAAGFNSNHKLTGHSNRGARLESVNSDASELAFTDIHGGQAGGPAHATLDVSSTSYVSLNSKGSNSGLTDANSKGQQGNVGIRGGIGQQGKHTPEYSEIGVQTTRPVNAIPTSPQQATINPRSSNVYSEPTDSLSYSLAKIPDTERNGRSSAAGNEYSEIGDIQAALGLVNFKTSET